MAREKMSRNSRAQQFLPFDALKGLQKALRLAEYENEAIKNISDLSEDEIEEISSQMLNHKNSDIMVLGYFEDGHILEYQGYLKIDANKQIIIFDNLNKIEFSKVRYLRKYIE